MSEQYKPTKPGLYEKMRKKALKNPEISAEYEAFRLQYELAEQMRKKREAINMTQEDVAEQMHTKKTTISRLESTRDAKHSPSISTLCRYAMALGYTLKISLVPVKAK